MWCADCEDIKTYLYPRTRFFFFLPTLESVSKLTKLCESLSLEVMQHHSHSISVEQSESMVESFLVAIFGELQGPERFNTKVTTTRGARTLDFDAISKIISLDVFINRYKSLWIIDSVAANNYETWFQPIVSANYSMDQTNNSPESASIFAHEALFRIRDQTNEIIPPSYVFSIAAKSDLLFSLDLTARRSAIEHAAVANLNSKVFVNFDPSSIYDPSYCLRSTASAIAEAGLRCSDVVFEVTETHRVHNVQQLKGILAFYRESGFQIALDDVGAGWSGLNLLKDLMPDYIKIDMELIRDIDIAVAQQKIVRHLIASAKDNGIKVIAEGIETQAEAECLRELQADYLQGFYFGRPELKTPIYPKP